MTQDWMHVGEAVRRRRELLGIPQGVGGVSAATWRKVEKAIDPPYRVGTLAKICRAIGWTPDSIDRLLEGLDPVETRSAEPASYQEELERRITALEAEVGWIKVELEERNPDRGTDRPSAD